MNANVRKQGNSAGTTIPVPILDAAEMSLGEQMNVEAKAGRVVIYLRCFDLLCNTGV